MFLTFKDGKMEQVDQLPEIKQSFPSGLLYATEEISLPDGSKQIRWTQCNIFTSEELQIISVSARVLERLFDNLYRFDAVRDAFEEFTAELDTLCSNNPVAIATVDRRLRAYFFEWKLFLEHWKKYIDDGAQTSFWVDKTNSPKYIRDYQKLYKDATQEAYDTCQEYVLATVIRNHVAHANNAINANEVGPPKNAVYVSKCALLSGIGISKSARKVIENQPENIDLYVVAKKSFEAAKKIMNLLMNFQIDDENVRATEILLNAYRKIEEAGIISDRWMISNPREIYWEPSLIQSVVATKVMDKNGNPVHEEPIEMKLMTQTTKLSYQPLNWKGYIAYAELLATDHKI